MTTGTRGSRSELKAVDVCRASLYLAVSLTAIGCLQDVRDETEAIGRASDLEIYVFQNDLYLASLGAKNTKPGEQGGYSQISDTAKKILETAGSTDEREIVEAARRVLFIDQGIHHFGATPNAEDLGREASVGRTTDLETLYTVGSVHWVATKREGACFSLSLFCLFLFERLKVKATMVIFGPHAFLEICYSEGNHVFFDPSCAGRTVSEDECLSSVEFKPFFEFDTSRKKKIIRLGKAEIKSIVHYYRAGAHLLATQKEEAMVELEKSIGYWKGNEIASHKYMHILTYGNESGKLIEFYERVFGFTEPSARILMLYGLAKWDIDGIEKAKPILEEALETSPMDTDIIEVYATLLFKLEEIEKGTELFQRLEGLLKRGDFLVACMRMTRNLGTEEVNMPRLIEALKRKDVDEMKPDSVRYLIEYHERTGNEKVFELIRDRIKRRK